jgi:hypothetical protein
MTGFRLHDLTHTLTRLSNVGTGGSWALVVSKWEWSKLICLSLLISVAITTALAIVAIYFGATPEAASFVSHLLLSTPAEH